MRPAKRQAGKHRRAPGLRPDARTMEESVSARGLCDCTFRGRVEISCAGTKDGVRRNGGRALRLWGDERGAPRVGGVLGVGEVSRVLECAVALLFAGDVDEGVVVFGVDGVCRVGESVEVRRCGVEACLALTFGLVAGLQCLDDRLVVAGDRGVRIVRHGARDQFGCCSEEAVATADVAVEAVPTIPAAIGFRTDVLGGSSPGLPARGASPTQREIPGRWSPRDQRKRATRRENSVMTAAESAASEAPARLSDVLVLDRRGGANRCQWLRGHLSHPSTESRRAAVAIVADAAVRWQCRGAVQRYDAWRQAVEDGTRLSEDQSRKLVPFIRPAFGLPTRELPTDHLQGHVAEHVWYILAQENLPNDLTLRMIEGPSFSVTTPGGDGLAVYQRNDAVLVFRLWEIKKHESTMHLSRTVARAYTQLDKSADVYLAELTTLAGTYEPEIAELYAALSDLWIDRDERAGAGVAVSTSDSHLPDRCFGTMHKSFPDFGVEQMHGLVVSLGDFPAFASAVRDRVWSAL